MNKRDYFLMCMNTDTYMYRDWVISAFSVVDPRPHITEVTYPYQIIYDPADPEGLFFAKPEGSGYISVRIEGVKHDHPLYGAKEGVDIVAGDLPLQHDNVNTTYGIMLGNMYLLYYPFGNKFKFHNGVITNDFEQRLTVMLSDNIPGRVGEQPDRIYVHEFEKYGEACGALAGYDKLFASSGSLKALTVDPAVIELRDRLIEENKHQLFDRRVQAEIEEQVVAADKASFKGDPAEDFLITGKSFNPTRKKQLIMIGGSAGFGGDDGGSASFIPTSLRDGWRVEDIPVHANEARAGSFFRGKETALGGADVKNGTRMGMNSKIDSDYCGTKIGLPTTITSSNSKKFYGLYAVGKSGPILIDENNVQQFIDRPIMVHSPAHCISKGDAYCKTCIGKTWSLLVHGVNNTITNIGDVFMYDKMKRMHGKALKTATFHFLSHIS